VKTAKTDAVAARRDRSRETLGMKYASRPGKNSGTAQAMITPRPRRTFQVCRVLEMNVRVATTGLIGRGQSELEIAPSNGWPLSCGRARCYHAAYRARPFAGLKLAAGSFSGLLGGGLLTSVLMREVGRLGCPALYPILGFDLDPPLHFRPRLYLSGLVLDLSIASEGAGCI